MSTATEKRLEVEKYIVTSKAQFTHEASPDPPHKQEEWNPLFHLGVFTLEASNIKENLRSISGVHHVLIGPKFCNLQANWGKKARRRNKR